MTDLISSDVAVLDLLRKHQGMTVADFQKALDVTATAVRQRLTRLMAQGYVRREAIESTGRGRPSHRYHLTQLGRRKTGANFGDLALVLWEEVRAIKDFEVRKGLLQRLSARLAGQYSQRVSGANLSERMESLVDLFRERQIPFEVQHEGRGLPVLTALACPYPDLAERDPSICAMERMLFSELLGEKVSLDRCRLDGDDCCTFRAAGTDSLVTTSQETT
jgi:predicted ArsR family transcriptional regulator